MCLQYRDQYLHYSDKMVNLRMSNFPVLSIHQFDKKGVEHEVYVNTFTNHLLKHHAHILIPHQHDFYLTVLFTKGKGFHEIDFRRYTIEVGTLFFMQPGQTHHWEFTEEAEGIIFFHSKDYFQLNHAHLKMEEYPFFFSKWAIPMLSISDQMCDTIASQFELLLKEFESGEQHKHRKIASLIDVLYIDLMRVYEEKYPIHLEKTTNYAAKFQDLEELINTHFVSERTVGFYADQLHMSSRHLNRICQEIVRKSFSELLIERTLLEAKRLITSGEMNMNEIAEKLGYEEYSYFSRLFKRYCGVGPNEFRKRYM